MKPALLLLTTILISACAPVFAPATATPTVTITPSPTTTFTPSPTATITFTPTPSLPADFPPVFAAAVGEKQWNLRDDGHVWVNTGSTDAPDWQDWYSLDPGSSEWWYSNEYLKNALIQAEITLENSWPPNDYTMDWTEDQFHGIFLDPEIIEWVDRVGPDGQVYQLKCTRIAFYDSNDPSVIHTPLVALIVLDGNKEEKILQGTDDYYGGKLTKNKAYRMIVEMFRDVPPGTIVPKDPRYAFYEYHLIHEPLQLQGDFYEKMIQGNSQPWPKDVILFVNSLLAAFYQPHP